VSAASEVLPDGSAPPAGTGEPAAAPNPAAEPDPAAAPNPAAEPDPEIADPELAELAHEVRAGLARLTWRLRAQRQRHGVGPVSLAVLSRLARRGTHTPKGIAEGERVQPQSLTRVLAGLEERGLVSRAPDPTDGRQSLITITEAGMDVLLEDSRERERWLAVALAETLTPTERELLRLAATLMARVSDYDQR
jgi:DNA-binding MarR family transcriptional regulator